MVSTDETGQYRGCPKKAQSQKEPANGKKKEQKNQDRQHTKQTRKQICKDKATSSLFLNTVMTMTSDQCTNHFQNSMCGHVHLEYINNQISKDGEFRCFPTVYQIVFALGKLTASLKPIKYIVF